MTTQPDPARIDRYTEAVSSVLADFDTVMNVRLEAAEIARRVVAVADQEHAAVEKVSRVDAEIRQACAAAIANPVGWGGPMVTSFAHTILRILNEDRAALKGGDDA